MGDLARMAAAVVEKHAWPATVDVEHGRCLPRYCGVEAGDAFAGRVRDCWVNWRNNEGAQVMLVAGRVIKMLVSNETATGITIGFQVRSIRV